MPDIYSTADSQHRSNLNDERLKANLKMLSVRGGAATTVAQALTFVIQMASTVVLARLLTPADFGVVAMVTAVIAFAGMFKNLGLSMATIQRAEISDQQISNLFWINITVSLAIALVIVAFAPIISWFYDDPRLTSITAALAVALVFGGLSVQHLALLQRHMRFAAIGAIQTVSSLIGLIATVSAAFMGAGYWALVIFQVAIPFTVMIGLWLACRWVPSRPTRRSGAREILAFGANITGFNLVNYLARNMDNILIGWRWGAEALGFYSKAYALMMLPLNLVDSPVSSVAIPTLSRLQDDPDRYRKYYLRAISLTAFVTMPGVAFLIVMSRQVVLVALGPQWAEAGRIFMILAIASLGQPLANSANWLFISQGRTGDLFKWGVIWSSISLVAFVAGLQWGAIGVAVCYSASNWAVAPFLYWYVGRKGPVNARDIWTTILPFLWVSLCVTMALLVFQAYVPPSNPLLELVFSLLIAVIVAPTTLLPFSRGREHLRDFLRTALFLAGRRA